MPGSASQRGLNILNTVLDTILWLCVFWAEEFARILVVGSGLGCLEGRIARVHFTLKTLKKV